MLEFAPHPLLHPVALQAEYPTGLGSLATEEALGALHSLAPSLGEFTEPSPLAPPPLDAERREVLRQDVRDLLRHGGHKPTGRGKPSCEYLVRAAGEGRIPRINPSVDVCNAVSLHTGLPISVVDIDRAQGPFRVDTPESGSYVFNASDQEIRLDGLLCLYDETGPIANAVKDSHGTKTHAETTRTLSIIWAPKAHANHVERAATWYAELLNQFGQAKVTRLT